MNTNKIRLFWDHATFSVIFQTISNIGVRELSESQSIRTPQTIKTRQERQMQRRHTHKWRSHVDVHFIQNPPNSFRETTGLEFIISS